MGKRKSWGIWVLKPDTFVLQTKGSRQFYEFDFDKCWDSAGILDQIVQIQSLVLLTDKDIRDLLRAIKDVLSPQANYCSLGKHIRNNPSRVAESRGYYNHGRSKKIIDKASETKRRARISPSV